MSEAPTIYGTSPQPGLQKTTIPSKLICKKNTADFQKIIHFQSAQQNPVNCCVNLYTGAGTVKPLTKAASHEIPARHIWHVEQSQIKYF